MRVVLGSLPVFRRLPSGSGLPLGRLLRLHSRMAFVLPRHLLRAGQRTRPAAHRTGIGGLAMTVSSPPPKLLPRNVSARRKGRDPASATRTTSGNPVSTRLEAGIGNCYPGLECDLRNLERRFFPFLEMDMPDRAITLATVDLNGARQAKTRG